MPEIINHDPFWYNKKIQDVYDSYRIISTICVAKLQEYVPNFTSKNKDITELEFVEFLRKQTEYADYAIFDYLVRYYNLSYDTNNNPIFTEEFAFDKKIKKEAFSIWCTDRMVRNHADFKCFDASYFVFTLQDRSNEYIGTDNVRKIKIDIFYSKLNICIEIDENHNVTSQINDKIKNAIMQQKGRVWIRLNYQNIHKGNITGTKNINDKFLNSIVIKTYYTELAVLIKGALLSNEKNMHYYILQSMQSLIVKEIQETTLIRDKNLQLLNILDKKSIANSDIKADYELDLEFLEKRNHYMENLTEDSQFMDLMNFAQRPEVDNFGNKAVSWAEIVKTTCIKTLDYDKFKKFLYKIKAITNSKLPYDKIYISWEQVGFVIFDFANDPKLRDLLLYYYVYLEKNMKILIALIKDHAFKTKATVENFDICAKFQSDKQYAKFLTESKKLVEIESNELAEKIKLSLDKIISKRDYKIQQMHIEIKNLEEALAIKKFVESDVNPPLKPVEIENNFVFTDFTEKQVIELELLRIDNKVPLFHRSLDEILYEHKHKLMKKNETEIELPDLKSLTISATEPDNDDGYSCSSSDSSSDSCDDIS